MMDKWTEAHDTAWFFPGMGAQDSLYWDGSMLWKDTKNEMLVSGTPKFSFLFVGTHHGVVFFPKDPLILVISNVESLLPCNQAKDHVHCHFALLIGYLCIQY